MSKLQFNRSVSNTELTRAFLADVRLAKVLSDVWEAKKTYRYYQDTGLTYQFTQFSTTCNVKRAMGYASKEGQDIDLITLKVSDDMVSYSLSFAVLEDNRWLLVGSYAQGQFDNAGYKFTVSKKDGTFQELYGMSSELWILSGKGYTGFIRGLWAESELGKLSAGRKVELTEVEL